MDVGLSKRGHTGLEYVNEVHEVEDPTIYTICLRRGVHGVKSRGRVWTEEEGAHFAFNPVANGFGESPKEWSAHVEGYVGQRK